MPEKYFARPRGRSLEAFKEWIEAIASQLIPNADDTITEEEWEDSWRRFWEKADGASEGKKSNEE